MKMICQICKKAFEYPFEQILHRHEDVEMELVPPNFWTIKDYLPAFEINISSAGRVILPEHKVTSKLNAGNTMLRKISKNFYVKDESTNPTGSFKDRGMDNLMNQVIMHGKKTISVVSCGSGAIATIAYAKAYGLESEVFVHHGISEESRELISKADRIFYSDTFIHSYEDYMKYCLQKKEVFWGFLNTNVSYMLGLRSLSYEIIAELGNVDTIILPCGSGMNIVAQNLALREMYEKGIISHIPKIGIVEIRGGNPIEEGFGKKVEDWLYVIDEPVDSKTILSNDTCFNYKKIYDIVDRGEGFFNSVTDDEIDLFVKDNPYYLDAYDYTSLSAMAAATKYCSQNPNKVVVAIMTCKNRRN